MSSLGEEFPKQQARVREILGHFKEIGPHGIFGASMIEQVLGRADKATVESDVVAMLRSFEEMKEVEG